MDLLLEDVAVTRGGRTLLSGVTFSVAPGQMLVLRGPNGIGKTTLLRCIAGLQVPAKGWISGAADRAAYAGHADGLKAMLSIRENLTFWAEVYRGGDVDVALEAYDLRPLADRLCGTLSAGQKRRVGLARLIVTGRPLWVMDEPSVSLDEPAREMLRGAVQGHLGQGGQVVLSTHVDLGLPAETLDLRDFEAVTIADEAFL